MLLLFYGFMEPIFCGEICSLTVLSVDHASKPDGQYFNFDKHIVDRMLNGTNWYNTAFTVHTSKDSNPIQVRIWRESSGGEIGDAHGRKDPISNSAENDWVVGDVIYFEDYYCALCSLNVLSVEHAHDGGTLGKYFNFYMHAVDDILRSTTWASSVYMIHTSRDSNPMEVIIWRENNGGSIGDAHGRKEPKSISAEGDWMVGDVIYFENYSCPIPWPTIIHDIWSDDFAFDINGVTGWSIYTSTNESIPQQYNQSGTDPNRYTLGQNNTIYHGPFAWWHSNTWLQRKFQCTRGSDVYVYYELAFCYSESNDVAMVMYLNQDCGVNCSADTQTLSDSLNNNFNDITLMNNLETNGYISKGQSSYLCTNTTQYWAQIAKNDGIYVGTEDSEFFELSFMITLNGDVRHEFAMIYNIQVECRNYFIYASIYEKDTGCPAQYKNLGAFPNVHKCAMAALLDSECLGDKIMWSDGYSEHWGCRCCPSNATGGSYNTAWAIYQFPTPSPTTSPTFEPTLNPSQPPTNNPTYVPTEQPTSDPTYNPSNAPSVAPSLSPSNAPSIPPTISPSFAPTMHPTLNPSLTPTNAPSDSPSVPPTIAPSMSPTTCYEGNIFTNDGQEIGVHEIISQLQFRNVSSIDKRIIANNAKYISKTLIFKNDNIQEIQCISTGSCASTDVIFESNTICNILCNRLLSCFHAIIDITECQSSHIICNGNSSCAEMTIDVMSNNYDKLIIECGVESSCHNMIINIQNKVQSDISCFGINACSSLNIFIEAHNYKNNVLNMYSYSPDVTYSNGFGYEEEYGSQKYITCNTVNRYVKYNNTMSDLILKDVLSDEYENNQFPCDGITVECFQDNNTNTTDSCEMKYALDTSTFNILSPNPSATCYWVSIFDIITISCDGACKSSPTESPTPAPTQYPTQPTTIPTEHPTIDPTNDPTHDPTLEPTYYPTFEPTFIPTFEPTLNPTFDPTHDPTIDPTNDPTNNPTYFPSNAPTLSPSVNPSISPTSSPSIAPTSSPSIAPSNAPTIPPSTAPSSAPSFSPTFAPSFSPTFAPSFPPTLAPSFSPTLNPSFSPTLAPSHAPTTPPTAAPSRLPTADVDKIYDSVINIEYAILNLTAKNKYFIVDYTRNVANDMEEIIESHYFDENNNLLYHDFWLKIKQINGKSVGNEDMMNTNANTDDKLTLYDLDVNGYDNKPMILAAKIECDGDNGEIIIKRSHPSTSFRSDVQTSLIQYFNNTDLYFKVHTHQNEIKEQLKNKTQIKEEDSTALYISIAILSIGILASIAALIFNKSPSTKVDNAIFFVPLLIAIGSYDFISDINLSIQILRNEQAQSFKFDNMILWLGILSIVFIIIPFGSNIFYAMRIQSQNSIRNCPSASAWFGKHLAPFILLCIACAGTYPVLELCSSRIFGLEFFESGLLSSDLHNLSKIKIRSTILMENLPQLLIQVIYSIVINELETATLLAFTASSLSVIAAIIIYQAQKQQNQEVVIAKYYIRFANTKTKTISAKHSENIEQNKGLKEKLGNRLCNVFNIPHKSIEIGFVTENDNGCIIHLQHNIFQENLKEFEDKLVSKLGQGYRIELTPHKYAKQLYEILKNKINDALREHFQIDDKDFSATYCQKYKDAHNIDKTQSGIQSQSDFNIALDQYIKKQSTAIDIEMTTIERTEFKTKEQTGMDTNNNMLHKIYSELQSQAKLLKSLKVYENKNDNKEEDKEEDKEENKEENKYENAVVEESNNINITSDEEVPAPTNNESFEIVGVGSTEQLNSTKSTHL